MNKLLFFSTLCCAFFLCNGLVAQTATKVHQSFALSDVKNVTIDIAYPYVVETWDGNTILLETTIDIDNAPPTLVKMFLGAGRYKVIDQLSNDRVQFKLQSMSRKQVLTSKGPCVEKIKMHFYVPKDVILQTLGNHKKEPQVTSNNK